MNRIASIVAGVGLLLVAGTATAMPVGRSSETSAPVILAATVCDQYGRCRESEDGAERIVRGVLGAVEGRPRYERREREYRREREDRRRYRDEDDD